MKQIEYLCMEASGLEAHTGFWLRRISNHVSHAFARKLAANQITVAEWVILHEMYRNKAITSPSKIAELTGLTRGAVSKLIDRLLHKQLVVRKEALDDRRFQDIQLTPSAIKLLPKLKALADKNDSEFFSVLTKAEQTTLNTLLKKIAHFHKVSQIPIK